jgi:leader peptidase (prepilin peptidase) / N-methyltransferase
MTVFFIALFAYMGASIASFLGVVAERTYNNQSVNGRSHCACGRKLAFYENVPVLGWLRVKGKAKCCGSRIPSYFFVTELLAGVSWGALGWVFVEFLNSRTEIYIVFVFVAVAFFTLVVESMYMHYAVRKES